MAKKTENKEFVKPRLEIKPVAWHDTEITKYQGIVTVYRRDGTKKLLTGDPMPSKEEAYYSLRDELALRLDDINRAINATKEKPAEVTAEINRKLI